MLEDTNELALTNTNGIITANTSGISLEGGKNKITIIDKNGNKKNIKVTVPLEYGREVLGYECDVSDVKWRLFHEDDNNIYLIADDYIPYANLPTSTNGTALNKGVTNYNAYFSSILSNYTGSAWVRENTNQQAKNWLSWVNSYPSSTNNNIKAVAYMMDTESWSTFAGEKAEYAIGGPTLELFCASYKVTHPNRYIECNSMTNNGYKIKWSDGSYAYTISGLTQDDYNSIYIKSDDSKAYGMWLASPSANTVHSVVDAFYTNHFGYGTYSSTTLGFRPIVCLKSDTKLMDNGDNTYSIKEQITAKAEYNKETNQIEVRVAYSDNGISKIMLNSTNELPMTNTNGIITANTAGIELANETHTITITDNKGNVKKLKVEVVNQKQYYGKEVTNYTCSNAGVSKWRVFHIDENNIYLIADDYVPYANLPTSRSGAKLNKGDTNYKAYFTAILNNYTGSAWIRSNTEEQARNWLSWVNSYPSSTNNNIKAVAYIMDTNKWSGFAGEKAEYAIGGPTIELFCSSYKVTHPDRYVECNSMTTNGYQVKWSDDYSYASSVNGITNDYESIYIKSDTTKAYGAWLASPSTEDAGTVMSAYYHGYVQSNKYSDTHLGFRPLVCLKSGVQLVDNGDGTCSIQ